MAFPVMCRSPALHRKRNRHECTFTSPCTFTRRHVDFYSLLFGYTSGGVPVTGTLREKSLFDFRWSATFCGQSGTSPALGPPKCTSGGKWTRSSAGDRHFAGSVTDTCNGHMRHVASNGVNFAFSAPRPSAPRRFRRPLAIDLVTISILSKTKTHR